MTDPQPISWRTIVYGTAVVSSGGTAIGTVHEVLGSDSDDIFHGLRVALTGERRDVMIDADDLAGMTPDGLTVSITADQARGLPTYDEEATYHLASVGWLRKHLGWEKDSKSDEEPG